MLERMNDRSIRVSLDPKHKKFADEFLICGNQSEAARRAGIGGKTPGVSANRLLKRPDIQQYLALRGEEVVKERDKEAEELGTQVIRELQDMAFANIGDFIRIDDNGRPVIDFSTATPEQLKAIASVKSKVSRRYDKEGAHIGTDEETAFSLADKYRGLELLGKHLGLFRSDEQRIVVDVADRLLAARSRLKTIGNYSGGGGG